MLRKEPLRSIIWTHRDDPLTCNNGMVELLVKIEASMKEGFDFQQNRFFVGGEYKYSYNNGNIAADPKLASMNFLNALERIPRYMEQYKTANEKLEQDIPVLQELVGGIWKSTSKP